MTEYKELRASDLKPELFRDFNRYQKVSRCWRKEQNEWVLRDIAFEENWGEEDFKSLIIRLINTLSDGGTLFGAFDSGKLIGFSSLEAGLFGKNHEYMQLSNLHISLEFRGKGIGKELFLLSSKKAKSMGAEKLYISGHSSEETQAFYDRMGCREALEYNDKLVLEEPYDCQLEYQL